MLIFWALVIAAIVWIVRAVSRPGTGGGREYAPGRDNALAILRERYARGEISKEEYDRMRQDLMV